MKNNNVVTKYKHIAIVGIILMGIGSFMSCLSPTDFGVKTGTILLCISIVLSIIGFSKWQH